MLSITILSAFYQGPRRHHGILRVSGGKEKQNRSESLLQFPTLVSMNHRMKEWLYPTNHFLFTISENNNIRVQFSEGKVAVKTSDKVAYVW